MESSTTRPESQFSRGIGCVKQNNKKRLTEG